MILYKTSPNEAYNLEHFRRFFIEERKVDKTHAGYNIIGEYPDKEQICLVFFGTRPAAAEELDRLVAMNKLRRKEE